jgi:hypothetical protein
LKMRGIRIGATPAEIPPTPLCKGGLGGISGRSFQKAKRVPFFKVLDDCPSRLFLKLSGFFLLMGAVMLSLIPAGVNAADEKIRIGLVEDVILLPWGVKIPARIDTGAGTSSLDARELVVKDKMAEFRLPEEYGGLKLRLRVVAWQTIRSAEAKERRPVVELDLCVGPKQVRARVNLNDRGRVKYPLLIGRNILKGYFSVDCDKEYCLPPTCPPEPSR